MNVKKAMNKKTKPKRRIKNFATTKEINQAADKVMTKYAEAIKRLADR